MKLGNKNIWIRGAFSALACAAAALGSAQSSYRIGENGQTADSGPVRMARFSLVSGKIDWRATANLGWSSAENNLPIRQGAQVWAPASSRAEVQFDDGSDMRLGGGAVATLTTLYSDDKGEFTKIKLNNGLATLHLVNKNSLYQIDTPTASIKAYGPALIRVGDTSGLEVAVQSGEAVCEGTPGKLTLHTGEYLDLPTAKSPCVVKHVPAADDWDRFNSNRDNVAYHAPKYVPQNIGLVAGGLDNYGSWHDNPDYGHIWAPREAADWRPYHSGHWVWEDPFGWTWVGNEDWGWAPYHYGTWVRRPYGWGWVPGPAAQCWSPAVVDFTSCDGDVAWCPLAPADVHYASIGFGSGDFYLSFSIGRTGCYYPGDAGFCEPRPWSNVYVNRVTYYDIHRINNYYGDPGLRSSWVANRFVPRNSRFGGSFVAQGSFGNGRGSFGVLAGNRASYFSRGHSFVAGRGNAGQISGPFNVRPVASSFTPSRSFNGHGPSAGLLNRQVYRSNVPRFAAQRSVGLGRTLTPPSRVANVMHPGGAAQAMHGVPGRGSFGVGHAPVRTGIAGHTASPAHSGPAANRFNRFNGVSHSQFTRPGVAAHQAQNANHIRNLAHQRAAATHSGSFGTRHSAPAGRTHGGSFGRPAAATHHAAPVHRGSFGSNRAARPNVSHRTGSFNRPHSGPAVHRAPVQRPSFNRPPAQHRSFSPPRSANHGSFGGGSRPSRPSRPSGGGGRSHGGGGNRKRGH